MKKKLIAMIVAMCAVTCAVAQVYYAYEVYHTYANGHEWAFRPVDGGFELCRDGDAPAVSEPYGDVTIPSKLDGIPVVAIGEGAFSNCVYLTGIVLQDGIASIGDNAFFDCRAIEQVSIPASVANLGQRLFYRCSSLVEIVFLGNAPTNVDPYWYYGINSSCTVYVGRDSVGWNTTIPGTWRGVSIEYADLPPTFTITDGVLTAVALNGYTEIRIPDGVTAIDRDAFRNCSALTALYIPDRVTAIAGGAFSYCTNLRDVRVNQYVCSSQMTSVFGGS